MRSLVEHGSHSVINFFLSSSPLPPCSKSPACFNKLCMFQCITSAVHLAFLAASSRDYRCEVTGPRDLRAFSYHIIKYLLLSVFQLASASLLRWNEKHAVDSIEKTKPRGDEKTERERENAINCCLLLLFIKVLLASQETQWIGQLAHLTCNQLNAKKMKKSWKRV